MSNKHPSKPCEAGGEGTPCKGKDHCGGTCDEHDDGVRKYYGAHIDHPPIGNYFDYGSIGKANTRSGLKEEDLLQHAIDEGY